MSTPRRAAVAHPHPARQPADRRRPGAHRRRAAGARRRRSRRCPSWRCPRGCPCPRAPPAPGRHAGCCSGCSSSRPTASTCGPWCASGAARPKASWSWRPRRRRTSSSSAGAGDPPGRPRRRRRTGVQPDHRRGRCETRRATSRSSSSGASPRSAGSWCRSGAVRTPSSRCGSRPRSGRGFDAEVDALHVVAPDLDPTLRVPGRAGARHASCGSRAARPPGRSSSKAPTWAPRSSRRRDRGRPGGHGRQRARRRRTARSFGQLPETVAQGRRGPTVIVVRTREVPSSPTFEQRAAQAETLEAAERAASTGSERARPGRPLVRRVELPPRRVRRPASAWWSSRRSRA